MNKFVSKFFKSAALASLSMMLTVFPFQANADNFIQQGSKMTTLKITTYNPGTKGIFPVSSNLIEGESEVILVDSQFQKPEASISPSHLHSSRSF